LIANANGNLVELEAVAVEYDRLKMVRTAAEIRLAVRLRTGMVALDVKRTVAVEL
jgi:hypothetical protein